MKCVELRVKMLFHPLSNDLDTPLCQKSKLKFRTLPDFRSYPLFLHGYATLSKFVKWSSLPIPILLNANCFTGI